MPDLSPFQLDMILIALAFLAGASAMFAAFVHSAILRDVAMEIVTANAVHPSQMELEVDQEAIAEALGVMEHTSPK